MEESWTRSLTCLCLNRLGLALLWSEQAHNVSVCGFVAQIVAMTSPMCLKITGHGRSSHLEGHYHEKNPENRWVCCQLPRVPTPCKTINLTNQRPDMKLMCRWHDCCISSQSLMRLPSHCCRCPCPVNSNHGFNLRQNGGHFDMGSFPRPLKCGKLAF